MAVGRIEDERMQELVENLKGSLSLLDNTKLLNLDDYDRSMLAERLWETKCLLDRLSDVRNHIGTPENKVETRWRVDYFNEVRCFWESYPGFFHKEDDAVSSMKVGILGYRSRLVRLDISTNETIISERPD